MKEFEYKELQEDAFRSIVLAEHLDKQFKGDAHKMEINFKRKPNSVDFVSVVSYDDDEKVASFCGLDLFESKEGLVGFIHCLGVTKPHRGKKLSNSALHAVEVLAKEKHPDLKCILSVCNPISAKTHERNGYVVTNPGRLSKNGKLMQIRLKKDL